jgi:hypothetical protein
MHDSHPLSLRPGLSGEQAEFARTLFPIFEQTKGVMLAVSAVALLQRPGAPSSELAQESVRRLGPARALTSLWNRYDCPPTMADPYAAVADCLAHQEGALLRLSGGTIMVADAVEQLLAVYHALRAVTEPLWPLELHAGCCSPGHLSTQLHPEGGLTSA